MSEFLILQNAMLQAKVRRLERELRLANLRRRALIIVDEIASLVAERTGIPLDAIRSETRERAETDARQIVMYFANVHARISTGKIAHYLDRDHTTVIHGREVIKSKLCHNQDLRALIEELAARMAADSSSSLLSEREEEEKVGGVLR